MHRFVRDFKKRKIKMRLIFSNSVIYRIDKGFMLEFITPRLKYQENKHIKIYLLILEKLLLVRSFLRVRPIMFFQIAKSRKTLSTACLHTIERVTSVQTLMSS